MAAIAAVTPRAIASARHSRRTRNQTSPTPGVTLVRSGSAHAADHRKPMTMTAAYSRCTLPEMISNGIGRNSIAGSDQRPSSHHTMPKLSAVQSVANTAHGSQVTGASSCAKAGEYTYAPITPAPAPSNIGPWAVLQ